MKLLPEVCIEPWNNWIDFGDDPDYNPDGTDLDEIFTRSVYLGHPLRFLIIFIFGGLLQSQTVCLVYFLLHTSR